MSLTGTARRTNCCGMSSWFAGRPQCLKKRLKVRGRFAVEGDAISRAWMNELKVRCVESDASDSLLQRF